MDAFSPKVCIFEQKFSNSKKIFDIFPLDTIDKKYILFRLVWSLRHGKASVCRDVRRHADRPMTNDRATTTTTTKTTHTDSPDC